MGRLQMSFPTMIAVCAALALLTTAQIATAAIVGMDSGVTTNAALDITGLTVPGGNKAFPALVTSDNASHLTENGNTSGEIFFTVDANNENGTAHNLNINVPGGFFLIGNGYSSVDLRYFGGNELIKARDDDASMQDFVLCDIGGNDNFAVAAILVDNQIGAKVNIPASTFGKIQYNNPATGEPFGQMHGFIAFDISDLLDGAGNPLAADASIRGIRIYEHQGEIPGPIVQALDLVMFAGDVELGVPEPSTVLMAGVALIGLFGVRKRGN